MRDGGRSHGFQNLFVLPALGAIALAAAIIAVPRPAEALPSFARQTGERCGACHTDFPALTPFGRRFKPGGSTLGGSPQFRTAPFPTSEEDKAKPYGPPSAELCAEVGDGMKG